MVFEISAAIITLVIVVLAIYLVKLLKDVQIFLRASKATIERLEIEVGSIKTEIVPLLRESKEVVEKVNIKMDDVDPLFKSISNVGAFLNDATANNLPIFEKKKTRWQEKTSDFLELASIGLKLFQQFKKRR